MYKNTYTDYITTEVVTRHNNIVQLLEAVSDNRDPIRVGI